MYGLSVTFKSTKVEANFMKIVILYLNFQLVSNVLSFVQLCSPGLLDAVPGPEDLLHPRRPLEGHSGVEGGLRSARHQPPHLDIVNEGDVIRRVPVQAVVTLGEGHRVQQQVDGGHHLGQDNGH